MFVTGDYHSFWQAPLTTDFDDPAAPHGGATSSQPAPSPPPAAHRTRTSSTADAAYAPLTPGFNYIDGIRNGYGLIEANASELSVTYYANDAASSTQLPQATVRFTLDAGNPVVSRQLL